MVLKRRSCKHIPCAHRDARGSLLDLFPFSFPALLGSVSPWRTVLFVTRSPPSPPTGVL